MFALKGGSETREGHFRADGVAACNRVLVPRPLVLIASTRTTPPQGVVCSSRSIVANWLVDGPGSFLSRKRCFPSSRNHPRPEPAVTPLTGSISVCYRPLHGTRCDSTTKLGKWESAQWDGL